MDYNKTMKYAHVVVVASICMVGALGVGAADWNRMGPDAGNLTALAAHPSDPEIALAGTQYAGVFRTQDGGRSWVHTGLRELGITVFVSWPSFGVVKSEDGGFSWIDASVGLEHLHHTGPVSIRGAPVGSWCPMPVGCGRASIMP